jgi:hypothetical protein
MKIIIKKRTEEPEQNRFSFKQFSKISKYFNGYRHYFIDSKISEIIRMYETNYKYSVGKIMKKQLRYNQSGIIFFSVNERL